MIFYFMKKIFIVLTALVFYSTSVVAVEKMKFKYNFHENLPKEWIAEFKNIMNIVQEVMPINENTNDWALRVLNPMDEPFNIYVWLDTNKDPFPEFKKNGRKYIMDESCICGDRTKKWMQVKVYKEDLRKWIAWSYYMVPHEYFHIYQTALSKEKRSLSNYNPKWLVEGGAFVLGSVYTRQYYGEDWLESVIQNQNYWKIEKVTKKPHLYEKHKTSPVGVDTFYSGSAFMLLALVNELKKNNISEEEAFRLVFRDFWIEKAKHKKWEKAFEQTFGMSHDEFYERLSKYKRGRLKKILPSKTLKIEDIFS